MDGAFFQALVSALICSEGDQGYQGGDQVDNCHETLGPERYLDVLIVWEGQENFRTACRILLAKAKLQRQKKPIVDCGYVESWISMQMQMQMQVQQVYSSTSSSETDFNFLRRNVDFMGCFRVRLAT